MFIAAAACDGAAPAEDSRDSGTTAEVAETSSGHATSEQAEGTGRTGSSGSSGIESPSGEDSTTSAKAESTGIEQDRALATVTRHCGGCHLGENHPFRPDLEDVAPAYSDDGLRWLMNNGIEGLMPAASVTAADEDLVLEYVRDEFGDYDPLTLRDGDTLYAGHCAHCHQDDGTGNGMAPNLFERVPTVSQTRLVELITLGFRQPGRGLREGELPVFVDYVRSRFDGA